MIGTKTIKAAIGLCTGLLLSAGACDAEEPDDSSDNTEFRCAAGTKPGVGALSSVFFSGTAEIWGASGINGDFDLFSNDAVSVSGSARIWGNAYTTDGNVNLYNNGYLWGQDEGDAVTVPDWIPWNDVNYIWNNRSNNNIGSTSWGRDPTYYYNRNLRVYGGEYLWLAGGNYYFTDLSIADGSELRIYGNVNIVIDGPMSVSNGARIVTYNNAEVLFIGVNNQPIEISNGAGVYNTRLYAPRAPIMISGTNSQFAGGLVGDTLQVSGSSLMEVRDDALHIWNPC